MKVWLLSSLLLLLTLVASAGEPEVLSVRSGKVRTTRHQRTAEEKCPSVLRWWENAPIRKTDQEKAADAAAAAKR